MKLRLLALALAVCGGAAAQNPYIALQGANETADGIVVSQPARCWPWTSPSRRT